MIKITTIQLKCDVCDKESFAAAPEMHVKDGWKWNRYKQMPGYYFFAMTCSAECKAQWEGQYKALLYLSYDSEIDLTSAVPTNRDTETDNVFGSDKTFFARAYYAGTGEEYKA